MSSTLKHKNLKARLNHLLYDRYEAEEKELRKYYVKGLMGFLVAMFSYLFDDAVANVPIFAELAYTGIFYWMILIVVYFLVNEIKYLLLAKELGLQLIVFYFVYHSGGAVDLWGNYSCWDCPCFCITDF